jgi:hypothetical protein
VTTSDDLKAWCNYLNDLQDLLATAAEKCTSGSEDLAQIVAYSEKVRTLENENRWLRREVESLETALYRNGYKDKFDRRFPVTYIDPDQHNYWSEYNPPKRSK